MKCVLMFFGVLFIAGLMGGCACNCDRHEQMIEEVKQLDKRFTDSFSKGDVDGVMDCYWNSPELVVYPPASMESKGYATVKEAIAGAIKAMPGGKLEMIETHYMVSGKSVISWGLWKISFPDSQGKAPDMLGRYTEVAVKKDGKWVLIHDHPSVPLPPSPAGKP